MVYQLLGRGLDAVMPHHALGATGAPAAIAAPPPDATTERDGEGMPAMRKQPTPAPTPTLTKQAPDQPAGTRGATPKTSPGKNEGATEGLGAPAQMNDTAEAPCAVPPAPRPPSAARRGTAHSARRKAGAEGEAGKKGNEAPNSRKAGKKKAGIEKYGHAGKDGDMEAGGGEPPSRGRRRGKEEADKSTTSPLAKKPKTRAREPTRAGYTTTPTRGGTAAPGTSRRSTNQGATRGARGKQTA